MYPQLDKQLVPVAVGLTVLGIGLSLGHNCGYAINPARDLAPRLLTLLAGWGPGAFTEYNHWYHNISTYLHLTISIISTQVAGPHTGHPCWRPGRGLALLPRGGGQLAGRGRGGRGEVRQRGGGRPRHRGVSAGGRGQTTARSIINNFAPQYAQLAQYQSSLPVSPGPNLKM